MKDRSPLPIAVASGVPPRLRQYSNKRQIGRSEGLFRYGWETCRSSLGCTLRSGRPADQRSIWHSGSAAGQKSNKWREDPDHAPVAGEATSSENPGRDPGSAASPPSYVTSESASPCVSPEKHRGIPPFRRPPSRPGLLPHIFASRSEAPLKSQTRPTLPAESLHMRGTLSPFSVRESLCGT